MSLKPQLDKLSASSYKWKISHEGGKALVEIFKVVKIASVIDADLETAIAAAINEAESAQ